MINFNQSFNKSPEWIHNRLKNCTQRLWQSGRNFVGWEPRALPLTMICSVGCQICFYQQSLSIWVHAIFFSLCCVAYRQRRVMGGWGLKPFYIRKCWQNRQYSAWRSKKRAISFILAAQKSPWFFFLSHSPFSITSLQHYTLLTIFFFLIASSLYFHSGTLS